jgi:hypothetical protein
VTEAVVSMIGGAGGATALGASHVARGKPNQDAVGWTQRRLWTFLAVADGHGSAPHYRSDRGSRMAVDCLITLFREITQDGVLREPDALARHIPTLAGALVARWRAQVEADIATDPIAEPAGTASHVVYGSTCLGAAIGPGLMLALQIGDGDLFAGTTSGDIVRLFEPDDTVGEQTYSLCLPDATEHVKIALFTAPSPFCAPDFALCSTDGLAKSFADESAVLDVVRGYRNAARERGVKLVTIELRDWLVKCSQMGSGDDVSVAFFTAETEVREEALPMLISGASPTNSFRADRQYSSARRAIIAALICGAFGGLVAGLWGVPWLGKMVTKTPLGLPSQVPLAPVTPPTSSNPSGETNPAVQGPQH